ncbi:hypothetical protein BB559_005253 [Furculomyces boomerangus]|uniref:Large ribosomal subunit protein mL46 N-terminal domain-containing protein n=1 Tax=Furculomyces boomerangus TaxID=61424 RepID=A0A2T9Y9Q6_9FUNG|nr:hypothetical protein BB559_005253 [Furculomyces boomerangus]
MNRSKGLLLRSSRKYSNGVGKDMVCGGVVIQRNPIITREVPKFELEYKNYMEWLKFKSAVPFAQEFYFKKGSISERTWMKRDMELNSVNYFDQNDGGSNVESKKDKASINEVEEEESVGMTEEVELLSRVTEADRKNDQRSLERKLDRTLYFMVKKEGDKYEWQFPSNVLEKDEVLFKCALRTISETCGTNIDAWIVGRGPIGHILAGKEGSSDKLKTFFLKAHILAGGIDLKKDSYLDYAWVNISLLAKSHRPDKMSKNTKYQKIEQTQDNEDASPSEDFTSVQLSAPTIPETSSAASNHAITIPNQTENDGVFSNMSVKPALEHYLDIVEKAPDEPLPTYLDIYGPSSTAAPSYFEPATVSIGGTDELLVDGLPVGNFFIFMCNFMISYAFQIVGFMMTFLLHTTHAAKNGSIAGFGATLINIGFYIQSNIEDPSKRPPGSPPKPPTNKPEDDGLYFDSPGNNLYIAFLLIVVGWCLIIKSGTNYFQAKRMEQIITSTPEQSQD